MNQTSKLYFATYTDLKQLRGFKAIHTSDVVNYSIQPTCCRELIFTIPEVLVSPGFDKNNDLFMIAEESIEKKPEFLRLLNRLKIKLCSRIEVDREFFQFCFSYTFYQKLAPFWNKVSTFLVNGRCFLQECEKMPALKAAVSVTDHICLALDPFLLKMKPPTLEDFLVEVEALWNFKRSPGFVIQREFIRDPTCYVLPSLKKGRVVSITHTIPSHAPFKGYEEMRQHWKLMYGYHLPVEKCQLFFNIRFFGETTYTYPEWCIRKHEPIQYMRCDQDEICRGFLQDLTSRMATVCGVPLKLTKQSLFWESALYCAGEGSKSSLVKSQPVKPPHFPGPSCRTSTLSQGFRYCEEDTDGGGHERNSLVTASNDAIIANNDVITTYSVVKRSYPTKCANIIEVPDSPFVCITSPLQKVPDGNENVAQMNVLQKVPDGNENVARMNVLQKVPDGNENVARTNVLQKVPDGNENVAQMNVLQKVPDGNENVAQMNVLQKVSDGNENVARMNVKNVKNEVQKDCVVSAKKKKRFVPVFKTSSPSCNGEKLKPAFLKKNLRQSSATAFAPTFKAKRQATPFSDCPPAKKKSQVVPNRVPINTDLAPVRMSQKPDLTPVRKLQKPDLTPVRKLQKPDLTPGRKSQKPKIKTPFCRSAQPRSSSQAFDLAMEILSQTHNQHETFSALESEQSGDVTSLQGNINFACQQTPDSTVNKKPRSKPRVQETVDVVQMAQEKQLNKVNSITLKSWLNEKGVTCKSSEKKDSLIEKVEVYLNIRQKELVKQVENFINNSHTLIT